MKSTMGSSASLLGPLSLLGKNVNGGGSRLRLPVQRIAFRRHQTYQMIKEGSTFARVLAGRG